MVDWYKIIVSKLFKQILIDQTYCCASKTVLGCYCAIMRTGLRECVCGFPFYSFPLDFFTRPFNPAQWKTKRRATKTIAADPLAGVD